MAKLIRSIFREEWRDVPGFWGRYQVSNRGRLKILQHIRQHKHPTVMPERILTEKKTANVYPRFNLAVFENGTHKDFPMHGHTAIGLAFKGGIPKGMVMNHKNNIRWDNAEENLEVCTTKHNVDHAHRIGAAVPQKRGKGSGAVCLLNTETGIYYDCIKDAADAHGINYNYLLSMLNAKVTKNKNKTSLIKITKNVYL